MTTVSLQRCTEYDNLGLKETILAGLKDIGFDLRQFNGKKVALKANLLTQNAPEKAIITHPEFFRGVAQIVSENNGIPILAECPAITSLEKVVKKTGYQDMLEQEGVEIADTRLTEVLFNPNERKYRRFEILKAFFDADIMINLPKFKTHGITYITGAVKNVFGMIPGLNKSKWHMKIPDPEAFSEMLLDLNEALLKGFDPPKTFLHTMDAVVGQEGEGPGPAGTPRLIGAVIVGDDPVAVDWAAVNVAGLDVEKVVTITSGFKRGHWAVGPDDIKVTGESIADLKIKGFVPTKRSIFSNVMRGPVTSRISKNLFTEKPVPNKDKCSLCYQCMKICPAEAISKQDGKKLIPSYDYDKCIRCYCCMEICPGAAISLKKGMLQWPR